MLTEEQTHLKLCNYLHTNYPDIIFTSDLNGIKLTPGQARKIKNLKSSKGIPDLIIFEPNKFYFGLLLEIKKEGVKVFKKNGDIIKNEHIQEQNTMIERLKQKGFLASFGIGYDDCKNIIDMYMVAR